MEIGKILYLLVLLGTPAIVLAISSTKCLPIKSYLKLALLSFVIIYAFILASAQVASYKAERDLHKYDADDNGIFRSGEMSAEEKAALEHYSRDTGRNFAPISGFIFSFLYTALFFGTAKLVKRYAYKIT